jgi:hypothetical protein
LNWVASLPFLDYAFTVHYKTEEKGSQTPLSVVPLAQSTNANMLSPFLRLFTIKRHLCFPQKVWRQESLLNVGGNKYVQGDNFLQKQEIH